MKKYTPENGPQAYTFSFGRRYNGVDLKHIPCLDMSDDVNYRQLVKPESFSVTIDDGGIVTCYWSNHLEYVDTITNDVPIIGFSDIKNTFEKFCKYKFSWTPKGDTVPKNINSTININKVELNLMVTAEKDSMDTYILIPVWDFMGDVTYPQKVVCTNDEELKPLYGVSVLTINAIDGTVIDRRQGY